MKSKLSFALAILLIVIFALIAFVDREAYAQSTIELKLITAWPRRSLPQQVLFLEQFVEQVNKRSEGRVNITIRGPESVPPLEALEATRNGVFDLNYSANAYEAGDVPAAIAEEIFMASPSERRKAGWMEIMKEMYMKKAGVDH